jgi:O-antigen ligase
VIPARLVLPGFGSAGTPATLVGVLAFVSWGSATLLGQRQFTGRNAVRTALLAYLWFALFSWTLGKTRTLTLNEKITSDRSFIVMLSLAGIALVAIDGLETREQVETVVRRMTYCAMFMVLMGTVQFFFSYDPTTLIRIPGLVVASSAQLGQRSNFNRPFGTTLHPIEYGVVAAALVPLAYWIARVERRRRAYFVAVALGFAAMTSLSRSAVLAIAVAVIVLIAGVSWRQRASIMAAGVVFIMFVGVTVKGLIGTLRNLFTTADNDSSVQARIDRIPKVMHLISEHPWFGRGFGTYNLDDYFLLDNQLQMSAIETGLIGIAVLVIFIGFVSLMSWRTRVGGDRGNLPGTALAATILGLFISSYTFDAFFYRILTGVLYLSIGLVGAMYRITEPERAAREAKIYQPLLEDRRVELASGTST